MTDTSSPRDVCAVDEPVHGGEENKQVSQEHVA